jgi:hypothetical protein
MKRYIILGALLVSAVTHAHAIASKDDPIDQSQSYLEAQEKLISKTYGAKGNDVYRDGFYRTVSDVFKKDLGPVPRSDWYDGGIRQIGDPVIASMHDPKSYKFVHFTTETVRYRVLDWRS